MANIPDHQTRKVSLYFFAQGDGSTRVLDAEHPPRPDGWLVGRSQESDICWRNVLVSKHHAVITAAIDKEATTKAQRPIWKWTVEDTLSTNGTFVETYRLAPGVAYGLKDREVIQFGSSQCQVRISFDLDDTTNTPREIDPEDGGRERAKTSLDLIGEWVPTGWLWFTGKGPREQFAWFALIGFVVTVLFWIYSN